MRDCDESFLPSIRGRSGLSCCTCRDGARAPPSAKPAIWFYGACDALGKITLAERHSRALCVLANRTRGVLIVCHRLVKKLSRVCSAWQSWNRAGSLPSAPALKFWCGQPCLMLTTLSEPFVPPARAYLRAALRRSEAGQGLLAFVNIGLRSSTLKTTKSWERRNLSSVS
jgi:hypothetical protein